MKKQKQDINFHTVMVGICDTFKMTHPQMMTLRRHLEGIYAAQTEVTLVALAITVERWLKGGVPFNEIINRTNSTFIEAARSVESERQAADERALVKLLEKHKKKMKGK